MTGQGSSPVRTPKREVEAGRAESREINPQIFDCDMA